VRPPHASADGVHDPGELVPRGVRQRRDIPIVARPAMPVRPAQSRSLNPDDRPARRRCGHGHVSHIRHSAEGIESHGAHSCCPLWYARGSGPGPVESARTASPPAQKGPLRSAGPPEATSADHVIRQEMGSGTWAARPPAPRQTRGTRRRTPPRPVPAPARSTSAHPQSLRLASPSTPSQDHPATWQPQPRALPRSYKSPTQNVRIWTAHTLIDNELASAPAARRGQLL
jgi:hypothetical protein